MGNDHGDNDHHDGGGHRIMPYASLWSSPQCNDQYNSNNNDSFVIVPSNSKVDNNSDCNPDNELTMR